MSPTIIAFIVGVFVGVSFGIFIIGILQIGREEQPPHPPTMDTTHIPLKDWGPED